MDFVRALSAPVSAIMLKSTNWTTVPFEIAMLLIFIAVYAGFALLGFRWALN